MDRPVPPRSGVRLAVAAASVALCTTLGCAGLGGDRSEARFEGTEDGFRITESAALGLGARSAFREATRSLEAGETEAAIERLREIAEAEPGVTAPRVNLALALREAGRYDEAEAELLRAIESNPRHPAIHNELGIVHRRQGRFADARASYERALQIHADFHFAHRNRGIVCELFLHDDACALESYRAYLESAPRDPEVEMWVALLEQRAASEVER